MFRYAIIRHYICKLLYILRFMLGIDIIFGIVILILSVVVHEVSHGYAADTLGDPTARIAGRLTLNPLRHLDITGSIIVPAITVLLGGFIFGWAKPVPFNPYNLKRGKWSEALVAAAGPVSNLALAFLFGLIIRFGVVSGAALELAQLVVWINIILALFNLIPIPPLDGSKILFALLPYHYMNIRRVLEQYGIIIVLLFALFLWQLILPVIHILFRLFTGMGF